MNEPQYYILDGVHRGVAARELGVAELPAKLFVAGGPPREVAVRVDSLHSPLDSVDRFSRRFFDICNSFRKSPRVAPIAEFL